MNPIMVSDKTKQMLKAYKHENEEDIIKFSKEDRKFASWDKTLQFLLSEQKEARRFLLNEVKKVSQKNKELQVNKKINKGE
jgi:hypothetical protein